MINLDLTERHEIRHHNGGPALFVNGELALSPVDVNDAEWHLVTENVALRDVVRAHGAESHVDLVLNHLSATYAAEAGAALRERLTAMLDRWRRTAAPTPAQAALDVEEVLASEAEIAYTSSMDRLRLISSLADSIEKFERSPRGKQLTFERPGSTTQISVSSLLRRLLVGRV